jgi:hypothetical protein
MDERERRREEEKKRRKEEGGGRRRLLVKRLNGGHSASPSHQKLPQVYGYRVEFSFVGLDN